MRIFRYVVSCSALVVWCGGCALVRPYTAPSPRFTISEVKREEKLLAIDGQSRLVEAKGIDSHGSKGSGRFTGVGGLDKWRYEKRFLPPSLQGEEYVVRFVAKGPRKRFEKPVSLRFEYMYAEGFEVHYSEKIYENLSRGRHNYVWKNIGAQHRAHGDIVGWRVSLHHGDREVASCHSALWRPGGNVVLEE